MVIRILSSNIGKYWDLIKYSLNMVERIGSVDDKYYISTLIDLLSDKSQCFIAYNDKDIVKSICITDLRHRGIFNSTTLHIRCLYSFEAASNDYWADAFKYIVKFARAEKCDSIIFETSNHKIRSIAKTIGAIEVSTNFKLEV